MSENPPTPNDSKILIYQSDSGETRLEVRLQDETVWLTQNLMAKLYQTTKQNISLHIQNSYEEDELAPEATVKEYLTVRREGSRTVKRLLDYYSLDMIIAVDSPTTLMSCWPASGRFAPAKPASISASARYSLWRATTSRMSTKPRSSSPPCKTRCTLPPRA